MRFEPSFPRLLSLLLLLLLASQSAAGDTLTFSECRLTLPDSSSVVRAECAELEVPENGEELESTALSLSIAVLRARSDNPRPDPLFFLAGGPGQSAIDVLIEQRPVFFELNKRRDIVFVDQRGTGRSNRLDCPLEDLEMVTLEDDSLRAIILECLEQLEGDAAAQTVRCG